MRTSLLIVVPCILLAGLVVGAYQLGRLPRGDMPCIVGTCSLSLHEGNAGEKLVYPVGTRFTVTLDDRKNPHKFLQCSPEGIIVSVADASPAAPPLYTTLFEATSPGTCTLTGNVFIATIVVE